MKILKRDFDAAVKQPFSTKSCLIAQAMIRLGIEIKDDPCWFAAEHNVRKVMGKFDLHFKQPGDEKKPQLQKLRASLPIQL